MEVVQTLLQGLLKSEKAISSVDYVIMLGIIGAGILAALCGLGGAAGKRLNTASAELGGP